MHAAGLRQMFMAGQATPDTEIKVHGKEKKNASSIGTLIASERKKKSASSKV